MNLPNDNWYKWKIFRWNIDFYGYELAYRMLRKRMGK